MKNKYDEYMRILSNSDKWQIPSVHSMALSVTDKISKQNHPLIPLMPLHTTQVPGKLTTKHLSPQKRKESPLECLHAQLLIWDDLGLFHIIYKEPQPPSSSMWFHQILVWVLVMFAIKGRKTLTPMTKVLPKLSWFHWHILIARPALFEELCRLFLAINVHHHSTQRRKQRTGKQNMTFEPRPAQGRPQGNRTRAMTTRRT